MSEKLSLDPNHVQPLLEGEVYQRISWHLVGCRFVRGDHVSGDGFGASALAVPRMFPGSSHLHAMLPEGLVDCGGIDSQLLADIC